MKQDGLPYNKLKIVCPYTDRLQFATEFFLRLEEPDTEFVDLSHSNEAYFELTERMWAEQETFSYVEQDIVIWPGALHELWECPELLCAYQAPYNITPVGGRRGLSYGLGCLKWHEKLIKKAPDLIKNYSGDRDWRYIDQVLTVAAPKINGDEIHYHWPPVGHLNLSRFPIENMISRRIE